jgi:hypothetical protein
MTPIQEIWEEGAPNYYIGNDYCRMCDIAPDDLSFVQDAFDRYKKAQAILRAAYKTANLALWEATS